MIMEQELFTYCEGVGCMLCDRCRRFVEGQSIAKDSPGFHWMSGCDTEERNSPLSGDTAFISERVEQASVAYEQCRRQGKSYYKSQRAAMAVLTDGL